MCKYKIYIMKYEDEKKQGYNVNSIYTKQICTFKIYKNKYVNT